LINQPEPKGKTMAKAKTKQTQASAEKAAPKKVPFKAGKSTYQVLEQYSQLPSISAVFRAMASDGYKRAEIAKSTGAIYQHVRNVLTAPVKKTS
jgi:hypothetical protein